MNAPHDKLYVLVRSDLPAGAKLAQSVHGMRQFIADHPTADERWFRESNTVAVLSVRDESHLTEILGKAERFGVRFSVFREPDFGDAATVGVLEPGKLSRKITSSLPLAS